MRGTRGTSPSQPATGIYELGAQVVRLSKIDKGISKSWVKRIAWYDIC